MLKKFALIILVTVSFIAPALSAEHDGRIGTLTTVPSGRWQIVEVPQSPGNIQRIFLLDSETGRSFQYISSEKALGWFEVDVYVNPPEKASPNESDSKGGK